MSSQRSIMRASRTDQVAQLKWSSASITLRMNMYIAQAVNGHFEVVKDLGAIDPKEAMLTTA